MLGAASECSVSAMALYFNPRLTAWLKINTSNKLIADSFLRIAFGAGHKINCLEAINIRSRKNLFL